MKSCKFCGKNIISKEIVCEYCGYNSQTDSRDPDFEAKKNASKAISQKSKSKVHAVKVIFEVLAFLVIAVVLIGVIFPGKTMISEFIPDIRAMISGGKGSAGKQLWPFGAADKTKGKTNSFKKGFALKKAVENKKFAIEVTGIVFDAHGKSFATINGDVVSAGDSIGMYTVAKINSDTVEIDTGSETKILRVSDTIALPKK
ncbi:MAG: hypothetical protein WDL87_10730 [Candidatus Omnitrophota bacterium]|jgi:hypothetical protein